MTTTIQQFEDMADPEHYAEMRQAGSGTPCGITGCRLSQEEHHRLAKGIIDENRDLKRRLAQYESGSKPAVAQPQHHKAIASLKTALAILEATGEGLAVDALEATL